MLWPTRNQRMASGNRESFYLEDGKRECNHDPAYSNKC
jgi:hypothetical protein